MEQGKLTEPYISATVNNSHKFSGVYLRSKEHHVLFLNRRDFEFISYLN